MLERLKVQDVALIESLEMEAAPGLNLITGETGSGKSILLDALGFVLGARSSAELIRGQAEVATVSAEFLPPIAWTRRWKPWFEEKGLPWDDGQLLLKRELTRAGRGRAWINGEAAPVGVLAELGQALVDFHGQHDHQALLRLSEHREFLDRGGRLEAESAAVSAAYEQVLAKRAALEGPAGGPAQRQRQLEFLGFQVRELEELAPKPDEFEALKASVSLQASAGKRAEALSRAAAALTGEEEGALPRAELALGALKRLAELDGRQQRMVEQLERGLVELRDVAATVRDEAEGVELDPRELERQQQRLHAFEKLARKHQCAEAGLAAVLGRLRQEQQALQFLIEDEGALKQALEKANTVYAQAALALSRAREKAGAHMVKAMTRELQELVSPNALFNVKLQRREGPDGPFMVEGRPCKGDRHGVDEVEFLFAPNLGEAPKPLAKIASGGELSRVTLALKTVFSRLEGAPCLVFDEIDSGISGRVAAVVGQKIAALAQKHQVLCITHLPQIASLPGRHFRVSKQVVKGQTLTSVTPLDGAGRQAEVAGLLGGEAAGASALAHARELLLQAAGLAP